MANIQKILERQKVIGDEIVCIHTKLADRPIRIPKLNEIKKRVLNYTVEFETNHETLLKFGNESEDYFTKQYFKSVGDIIDEINQIIAEEESGSKSVPQITSKKEINVLPTLEEKTSSQNVEFPTICTIKKTQGSFMEELVFMANSVKKICEEIITNKENLSNKNLQIKQAQLETKYKRLLLRCEKYSESINADELLIEVEDIYYKTLIIISNKQEEAEYEMMPKYLKDTENSSSAHLTKIRIPEFDGKINEWASFYDLFKNLIHDSNQLSDVEKMYRLTTSLKGEAKRLVQHLNITSNNYEAALEILKQRYENRRLLFTNQVDMLLDQPMVNSESSSSLKQLLDTTNSCIYALKGMNLNLEDAEPIIARIIIRKLDRDGLRHYEQTVKKSKEIQSLEDVMDFLQQQVQALEAVSKGQVRKEVKKSTVMGKTSFHITQNACLYCKLSNHSTPDCRKFLNLSTAERRKLAYDNKWCFNCIEHKNNKWCTSKIKCCYCGKGHHKMLHLNEENKNTSTASSMISKGSATSVLLATAQVKVQAANGEHLILRALIDQGSQITTLSEEAFQLLQLPKIKCKTEIQGLGGAVVGVAKSKTNLILRPRFLSDNSVETEALILPQLTGAQPHSSFECNIEEWNNYTLADPSFNESDRIDVVIGGDIIPHIIKEGVHKNRGILAQSTIFGWILSGVVNKKTTHKKILSAVTNLERFWELEEVSLDSNNHIEDEFCQKIFETTTKIDDDNRIVVNLPMIEENELGESRKQAMARLLSMEKKFDANSKLKEEYIKFMEEYEQLGHMKSTICNSGKYYLPHHAVLRESSLTTRLRVVFDASAKSTNGKSLNDVMYAGPKLQKDIFDILLKWRQWKYVMIADVEKMYRQVKVAEEFQQYQHILWRKNKKEAVKEYKLTTLTYGTASAPFLAVRALFYIADNCINEKIKRIIKEDFYMDDLMTGADTVEECETIKHDILNQLKNNGFILRKWGSNDKKIIENVGNFTQNELLPIKDDDSVKTLGLQWDPFVDTFRFNINFSSTDKITKRHVLSEVAKIFDPLGWLSPVTILAKLFIQKLWMLQIKWDEGIPEELINEWQAFKNSVPCLQKIRIPRWVQLTSNSTFELHGFSDASEKAYAALIYIKKENVVSLLTAKTKVNPVKNRKTLPKLELLAAHLLAKILQKVSNILIGQHTINAWSDSTITLAWIKNKTSKDKFVRNRVVEINNMLPDAKWRHVKSQDNPADVASRGIDATQLSSHLLWWNGPAWLTIPLSSWPAEEETTDPMLVTYTSPGKGDLIRQLIEKYSSYSKLLRVVAYVIKFINKLRKKSNNSQHLLVTEIEAAEKFIIRCHQELEFCEDITHLKKYNQVNKSSKIANLFPFIDKDGLLRVGGRLQNSNLSFNEQHPLILNKSHLVNTIINNYHKVTLHGGSRLMEANLRQKYWIINMKNIIKKCIRNCTKCIRYGQEKAQQLMGSLPKARVTVSDPFKHVGVDYAGPIQMKYSKGKGQKSYKGYIAVFVCMATKAIHLEAVSELTSDAFLAALKRFFSRRGVSSDIYSDNGTNFIGANKKLDKDFKKTIQNNEAIIPILASQRIQWHFIPPAAPHFGGIWEAGVKSVKFHLKRTIGESKLTYEEMSTVLAQIEAVLNSRPLVSLGDNNLENIDVLTPAHFLIGRSLSQYPEHFEDNAVSSLNRWKLIQKLKRDFWNRWRNEYLNTLQQRNKWKFPSQNFKEGSIVLIKDENTQPGSWPLARISETHNGKDGRVRVVTLKTKNASLKRPINKLCPFITADVEEDSSPPVKACFAKIKSRKISLSQILFILTIFLTTALTLPVNKSVSIKELSKNTAIYLDNVGQLNSINSNWNLVVYYDLKLYYDEIKRIGKFVLKVSNECQKLNIYKESCEMVMRNMERRYNVLEQNNNLLIHKSRNKRAPFEFVGSLYKILFGMMDATDRELMEENLRKVFDNQQDLSKLIQQQTSVVDSTVNILKKTTEEVNDNFHKMYRQLHQFSEEVSNKTESLRLTLFYTVVTTQLNLMFDECSDIQSSIINLLIDVNHGHINTNLLTPSQLEKELLEIEKVLPNNLALPGKTSGTLLKEIYHQMTAKGTIVDNRLVVKLEIPLMQLHSSEVYQIIKLPIDVGLNTVIPMVEDDFIVYNFASNMYYLTSQAQLNKCRRSLKEEFICRGNMPWKPAIERSCEVSALKQSSHAECSLEVTSRKAVWKQLSADNQWIFSLFDNRILTVDCGVGERNWFPLPLKGILKLPYGCTATCEGIVLTASKHLSTERFNPIKASSWELNYEKLQTNLKKPFDEVIVNNSVYIKQLQKDVDAIRNKHINLRELNFHTGSGHASLIIITLAIVCMIIVYIKVRCCSKNRVIKLDFSPPLSLNARQNVQQ